MGLASEAQKESERPKSRGMQRRLERASFDGETKRVGGEDIDRL